MLSAYSRYGARVIPITEQIIAACRARGEFIDGPAIARFEATFAARLRRRQRPIGASVRADGVLLICSRGWASRLAPRSSSRH